MASDPAAAVAGEDQKLTLDRERFVLDQRRLELDESFARKWGTIAVSVAVPISIALIGISSNARADGQREADNILAEKHKITEENRSALELYLKYMSDKSAGGENQISQIEAISSLSNDATFRELLLQQVRAIQARAPVPAETPGEGLVQAPLQAQAPSTILSGTTNEKLKDAATLAADFTTYVQYYGPRGNEARTVSDTLRSLSFSVPGLQGMDASHSPDHNQIRIYRTAQGNFAKGLAVQLKQRTGLDFSVIGPVGNNLPDGVLEIWLGKS